MKDQLLRKARQPRPFRTWQLLWRWFNTWPVTYQEGTGGLFTSAGMHTLVNEMLALRLVA